jgi:hypothetical protein
LHGRVGFFSCSSSLRQWLSLHGKSNDSVHSEG